MNNYKKYLGFVILALSLTSCEMDSGMEDYEVDMPSSMEESAYLSSYKVLTEYLPSDDLKLGVAVDIVKYLDPTDNSGVIVNTNFNEVFTNNQMKHQVVVGKKGVVNLENVERFIKATQSVGISIFGNALCDYETQNGTYLNSFIEPTFIPDEEHQEVVTNWVEFMTKGDCDYGVDPSISFWGDVDYGVTGHGATCGVNGGGGFRYKKNAVKPQSWQGQVQINGIKSFMREPENGESDIYRFKFDIRADKEFELTGVGTVTTSASGTVINGGLSLATATGGTMVNDGWQTFVGELEVAPGSDLVRLDKLNFNLGLVAADIAFDNISFARKSVETLDGYYDYVDQEEADVVITEQMKEWVNTIMGAGNGAIKNWSVVNNPLDDEDPSQLRSGDGLLQEDTSLFYWADYMGEDYVCDIVKFAREAGGADVKLFVSESGLENPLKCNALLDRIAEWESDGVTKIDGISVELNAKCDMSDSNYAQNLSELEYMFKLLSKSGKTIRLSGLDLGLVISGTDIVLPLLVNEELALATFYEDVLSLYSQIIPKEQRYGVAKSTVIDPPTKEPYGLWSDDFKRKHTYVGLVKGLRTLGGDKVGDDQVNDHSQGDIDNAEAGEKLWE